jgi:hypothetical protein
LRRSPSRDFCREACQAMWNARRVDARLEIVDEVHIWRRAALDSGYINIGYVDGDPWYSYRARVMWRPWWRREEP